MNINFSLVMYMFCALAVQALALELLHWLAERAASTTGPFLHAPGLAVLLPIIHVASTTSAPGASLAEPHSPLKRREIEVVLRQVRARVTAGAAKEEHHHEYSAGEPHYHLKLSSPSSFWVSGTSVLRERRVNSFHFTLPYVSLFCTSKHVTTM